MDGRVNNKPSMALFSSSSLLELDPSSGDTAVFRLPRVLLADEVLFGIGEGGRTMGGVC
jgi:hypothetical protein